MLGTSAPQVSRILARARSGGSIFRIKRAGDRDTELFFFPQPAGGAPVVFQGEFVVRAGESPPRVAYQTGSFKTLLKPGANRPDRVVAQALVRLLTYVKRINDLVT